MQPLVDSASPQDENNGSLEQDALFVGENEETVNLLQQTQNPHHLGSNTSSFSALMNLVKGNVGTGMLAMPIAFKYAGLWTGFFLLFFMSVISTYLIHVLLRTTEAVIQRNELDRSTIDYAEAIFNIIKYGPLRLRKYKGKIKHTVNVFLIISQFGFCCIYVLFISENIQYFMEAVAPHLSTNVYIIGFMLVLCLAPLCLIKNMRVFATLSALAILATLVGLGLIFAYLFTAGLHPVDKLPAFTNSHDAFIAFSIFIFSFEGISLTLPIQNKMINPHKFVKNTGVLNSAMVMVVCLSALVGFFGFLCFGADTLGSITYNIPNSPLVYAFLKPLFIFAILVSYLLQFYVPASIFGRLMLKLRCHREASPMRQKVHLVIMRTTLVFLSYGFAMVVPHLDLLLALLGAVCSSVLALLIPPLIETLHLWPEKETISHFWLTIFVKNGLFVVFGLVAMMGGTITTVGDIIETFR